MNAKNARKTFSFNVFLASIAGEPLEVKYAEMAEILGVSESVLSRLRHGRPNKMPPGLHPNLMASRFAAGLINGFPPTCSTAKRFASYAQMLNDKYIFSDSLARFIALFSAGAAAIDEERVNKFYSGMIPEFIMRCYEEAYSNTEQAYQNWLVSHVGAKSELVYQKICEAINEDILDSENLKQLLNVVYAASLRKQLPHYLSDVSFLESMGDFLHSQVNQPFYNFVHRSELISISGDSRKMFRSVRAKEEIVAQQLNPVQFTLTQHFHHAARIPQEEIIERAFGSLSVTVNGQSAVRYINAHENADYTSPLQFVTVTEVAGEVSGTVTTELVLRFSLYPTEAGEPINVEYEYSSNSSFIHDISSIYSYTLHYPCKSLKHEFRLDEPTGQKWGVWVKLFTPLTKSAYSTESNADYSVEAGTAPGIKQVVFSDWALPGAGYYRSLYELKHTQQPAEPSWY